MRATKGTQVISTNRRHQTQQGMPVTHSPQTVRAFYIQSLFILILCGRMCLVDVWFGLIYKIFPGVGESGGEKMETTLLEQQ